MRNKNAKNHYYRHPKTHQEKSKYYDTPELVRPNRRPSHIPSERDSIIVSSNYEKTWKANRKEQYTDKDYKKYSYMIPIDDDFTWQQVKENFAKQLRVNNYSYKVKRVNSLDGMCYIFEWTGKRIGDWPKGKYL